MPSQQVLEVIGANTYLYQQATTSSAVGIDDSASLFKIVTNASTTASISSSAQFSIDPSTNGNIVLTPNGSGTVNIAYGTPHGAAYYGTAGALLSSAAMTNGQMLIGSTGANPVAGTITSIGGSITVTTGAGTLNLETAGSFSDSFPTDSGTATPAAGVLNVNGGTSARDINTSGSGHTIHIDLNNAITLGDLSNITGSAALTATTGDLTVSAGDINMVSTTSTGTIGVYTVDGDRFLHNYGNGNTDQLFLGHNSGNFTLTVGTAHSNTGLGNQTLTWLSTGQGNTAVGKNCMIGISAISPITGSYNAIVGGTAFSQITSGNSNTGLGYQTGFLTTTGSNNIHIGYDAGSVCGATTSSNIIISNVGQVGDNNTIRIGTSGSGAGQQNLCYIAGINGINVGSVASVVSQSGDQLGSTTITAGTNISVTPGANTITIAATGAGGFTWSVITSNQTAAVNNGYICNKAGTLALALPATSAVGSIIEVTGINTATGWQITQAAGQQIFFGTSSTTSGATGTLTSSAIRDSIRMVCVVANLTWNVISSVGNITVV